MFCGPSVLRTVVGCGLLIYSALLVTIATVHFARYWWELTYHKLETAFMVASIVPQLIVVVPVSYSILLAKNWGHSFIIIFQLAWLACVINFRWLPFPWSLISYTGTGEVQVVIYCFWPCVLFFPVWLSELRDRPRKMPSKAT